MTRRELEIELEKAKNRYTRAEELLKRAGNEIHAQEIVKASHQMYMTGLVDVIQQHEMMQGEVVLDGEYMYELFQTKNLNIEIVDEQKKLVALKLTDKEVEESGTGNEDSDPPEPEDQEE